MLSSWRSLRSSPSRTPSSLARRRSEKPLRFIRNRKSRSMPPIPRSRTTASRVISSSICTRNQGSIWVSRCISSRSIPARKPSPIYQRRSGEGRRSSRRRPSTASSPLRSKHSSKPSEPVSRPRIAFCRDSCWLRPIAITSPTDFIWVVRLESA